MRSLVRGRGEVRAAMRRAGELGRRTEYLAFRLASDIFALPIGYVAEILKTPPITEVPRAPKEIVGIASVRGRLITVIDLRRKFRLAEEPFNSKTRILLVDTRSEEPLGLLVDEVNHVYRLADNEIEPAQSIGGEPAPHIAGIGRPDDGAFLILLELKPILASLSTTKSTG